MQHSMRNHVRITHMDASSQLYRDLAQGEVIPRPGLDDPWSHAASPDCGLTVMLSDREGYLLASELRIRPEAELLP